MNTIQIPSTAFHPLTAELLERVPEARQLQAQAWSKHVGSSTHAPSSQIISDAPLVASLALLRQLDDRVQDLCEQLRPWMEADQDTQWGPVSPLDVATLDFALVEDAEHGWGLRLVELQAFTSVVATVGILADIAREVWPCLADLGFHDATPSWRTSFQDWAAPTSRGLGALVETRPWAQKTAFDFEATRQVLGIPVVGLEELRRRGNALLLPKSLGSRSLGHILNRVILHTTDDVEAATQRLANTQVSWNSHPLGYYRVSKAVMPELRLPAGEAVARADEWQSLGRSAEDLVLKATGSFGGADVFLHTSEQQLESLTHAEEWLVQPRYKPLAVRTAADGAPVFAEFRCIVAFRDNSRPWTVARLARMYRGGKASSSSFSGVLGAGVAVLLNPPEQG